MPFSAILMSIRCWGSSSVTNLQSRRSSSSQVVLSSARSSCAQKYWTWCAKNTRAWCRNRRCDTPQRIAQVRPPSRLYGYLQPGWV